MTEKHELLNIVKELLELLVIELSRLNKRIEKIEENQARFCFLLELLLDNKDIKISKSSTLAEKISSILGRDKMRSRQMEEYISFLKENPEKVPLSGLFKKPSPHKE